MPKKIFVITLSNNDDDKYSAKDIENILHNACVSVENVIEEEE